MNAISEFIDHMLADPRHGWSIGTFGAVGEFMRDEDEDVRFVREGGTVSLVTPRAGIRVSTVPELRAVAFDTLSSDGETWGQSVLFCLPLPDKAEQGAVIPLGKDDDALRLEDSEDELFDLGVGRGHVRFCVRTGDARLADALHALTGKDVLGPEAGGIMGEFLRAQPHRVAISPVGRVEVYAPIPMPGGSSPAGPHTHLLPKMVASGLTHAANSPVPEGYQPVLNLHPRTPWRDAMGQRVPFDNELDVLFEGILAKFGLPQDLLVRRSVEDAVGRGQSPDEFDWPSTRRGRAAARIALRRLARANSEQVAMWRERYDRLPESELDGEEALHA